MTFQQTVAIFPKFLSGQAVPTTTQVKYLGSMVSWKKPLEKAFYHRAAMAEEAFRKLRLVWNLTNAQG